MNEAASVILHQAGCNSPQSLEKVGLSTHLSLVKRICQVSQTIRKYFYILSFIL